MSIVPLENSLEVPGPVVLFDGECMFCDWVVRFILQHERDHALYFAPLQSEVGTRLLAEIPAESIPDSVVYHDGARVFFKCDATIQVARHLRTPWSWSGIVRVLPGPVRDALYGVVAGSRYRIFGRKEACTVPSALERERELRDLPGD